MSVENWQIEETWRPALEAAGLSTLEAWLVDGRITVWRDMRERQNGVLDLEGIGRFHVKRIHAPRGGEVLAEVAGVRLLESAGIASVPLVAWGVTGGGQGVLVTSDLAGFRPADERMAAGDAFGRFAEKTAEVAGRLHAAGLHHRDLYLCHFLFDEAGEVRLIDAARVRKLPWLRRRRWIVKDLAQFRYSALQAGVGEAELEGWLSRWAERASTHPSRWDAAVKRKSAWIARHDKFLARTQPERYASVPRTSR